MATVLPASFPDDHSAAEHLIYRKLREETPSDWTALHSIGLANHARKLWAEIDFVVITDHAVLCLEVKGGDLRVEKGRWFAGDRQLTHTPFEQAGGAASALRRFLRAQLHADAPIVGWGVVFPHARFEALDPGADRVLVYDDYDRVIPIHAYVDRLATHWQKQNESGKARDIDPALHRRLVDLLAPTFDLYATLRSRVRGVNEDLLRLTSEQSEFLRGFAEVPRLVVRGGAGTGKTMLAMAESERLAVAGHRVLLSCANGRLAAEISRALEGHSSITVTGAYDLATSFVSAANAMDRIPDARAEDVLQVHLPEVARSVVPSEQLAAYSALVLDEAQDLISPMWLDLLTTLLEGGLESGCWRVFLDPNQDLILGSHPHSEQRLDHAAASRYRLTKNCRNTRQVATATALLTGLETLDTLRVVGPDVVEHWYRSAEHQRELAVSVLRDWIAEGLVAAQITVLSHLPLARSALNGVGERDLGVPIIDITTAAAVPDDAVRFATVADFKGFEADAVLLVDVDELSPGARRLELYVAMTRARAVLGLLLRHDTQRLYDDLAKNFAERLRQGLIAPR